jgi:hypothetical protein
MIPGLIGRSFDILRAWADGDLSTLQRLSTPGLGPAFAAGHGLRDDDPWRAAARAWVDAPERTVKGRTDGQRAYARFHLEHGQAWVLVFDARGPYPLLDGATTIPDSDFEAFGEVV